MKIKRSALFTAVLIAMISASSCSVEYRARHPRHKRVIVVGKAGETEKINVSDATSADSKQQADIAVY